MKIINQTSDQMTVKDSGGGAFVGIIFLIVGAGGAYLSYNSGQTGLAVALPVVFAVVGLVMLFTKATTIVDINKSAGIIAFGKKSLVSNKAAQYNIADVQAIELRESINVTNNTMDNQNTPQGISFGNNNMYSTRTLSHQTILVMKDGTEVPLESIKSSGASNTFPGGVLMSGRSAVFAVSNQVAQFIGVPFKEITPDQ